MKEYTKMSKSDKSIESKLNDIENIVEQIENNDIDLKKSLAMYSDAINLSKDILDDIHHCEKQFDILNQEKSNLES